MNYNHQTLIGQNRVSSTAISYPKYCTFEVLVEGPQVGVKNTGDWDNDGITGLRTFEEMVAFHRNAVEVLAILTGELPVDQYH